MDINTVVKVAYAINATCAVALVGVAAYSAKKQSELNASIDASTEQLKEGNRLMQNWYQKATTS
jgi:hypothetical protein